MSGSTAALEDGGVAECLGSDIRYLNPPYIGPPLPVFADGSSQNIWGIRRRRMPNEYGAYDEPVGTPYAAWTTVEEAEKFPWPSADWFDYGAVPALCAAQGGELALAAGATYVQDFIDNVAFGRGSSRCWWTSPPRTRCSSTLWSGGSVFTWPTSSESWQRPGAGSDFVFCGDDFGSQRGLLISPRSFDRLFAARKKELFDLAHAYGAKVSHHCCGSSRGLIPRFIECGMDALQTIQPRAAGMDPYELKREFGGKIALQARSTCRAILPPNSRFSW